jgi:hypothetical protein
MIKELKNRRTQKPSWRERFSVLSFFGLVIIGFVWPGTQAENGNPAPVDKNLVTSAVEKGLAWLANQQNLDGSWTCRVGYKLNESYIGTAYENVGVTALAGLTFLAHGDIPQRGKYGKNVTVALDFVLSCVRDTDGYITKNGTRMYEHAFATLFLAEVYGMSQRADLKEKLKKASQLIVQSQNKEGGWRYQPVPVDADISVTVSTLQALRAARNSGISVPKESIDLALRYIRSSAMPDGGFKYQLKGDARTSPALTAAGVVALISAAIKPEDYDAPEVQRGLRYLNLHLPILLNNPAIVERQVPYHYFYGHYYIAQAMYQGGEKHWSNYAPIITREILSIQQPDGHWEDDVGPTYATAMATLILQIPSEYLPIFHK